MRSFGTDMRWKIFGWVKSLALDSRVSTSSFRLKRILCHRTWANLLTCGVNIPRSLALTESHPCDIRGVPSPNTPLAVLSFHERVGWHLLTSNHLFILLVILDQSGDVLPLVGDFSTCNWTRHMTFFTAGRLTSHTPFDRNAAFTIIIPFPDRFPHSCPQEFHNLSWP